MSNTVIRQVRRKLFFINIKGRKCVDCGIDLYEKPWLADFHHKNPKEKEFTIASLSFSPNNLNKLQDEIAKCDLICCVCHRNKHFNINNFNKHKNEIYENIEDSFKTDRYYVTDVDKQNILKLHNDGFNPGKISMELFNKRNLRHTVTRVIKEYGGVPNEPKSLVDTVNKDKILEMLKNKKTVKQMADYYGMSKGNMFNILNELKITEFRTNGYRKNIKETLSKEILENLLTSKSVKQIANEYGCKSVNPIYRLIKKYELKNPNAS